MGPSWSCDLDHLYKLSFPLPKEAPHEIGFDLNFPAPNSITVKFLKPNHTPPNNANRIANSEDLDLTAPLKGYLSENLRSLW